MIRKTLYILTAGLLALSPSCTNKKAAQQTTETMDNELTMVVGTYTSGSSKGIYTFRFDQETGEAKALSDVEITNPSYLTISGDNQFVYAVSEHGDGNEAVTAFHFDKEKGTLQKLNSVPAMGADPCYIITTNQHVVTANYSGGSISVFPLAKDGSLLAASDVIQFSGSGADKERQEKSHLHCVQVSPDGKYLFADDLGTDHIYTFQINAQVNIENGEKFLNAANPPAFPVAPGSGPRHITFSPNGKQAYLINELSGAVIAFDYKDGKLSEIQSIQADTVGAKGSADIHVSPDGKFLYASNRLQADGLAIFSINQTNGTLTKAGYQLTGIHPRNFIITPNGKYLLVASRDNNAIEVYQRNADNGLLTSIGKDIPVDKPVCLKFAL
ncbi:lactonase family protein [Bacteroides sp. 51]|uniref:lactonase family protein n=1 Tax=Bacteroides sp. 51 TaxID=2302938 RepID=UPI0013CFAF9A|nr:lactonase family protein [Bacteroides sp. 51]NDV81107.1 lactonase family protein [Bacteroides sp. 51]